MQHKSLNDPSEIPEGSTGPEFNGWLTLSYVALIAVLTITLIAGLLPRGSFKENWLTWNKDSLRTEFGSFGLVHGEFPDLTELLDDNHQLIFDLIVVPELFLDSSFHVLAQVDSVDDPNPFIVGQWKSYLIIMQGRDYANVEKRPRLTVDIKEFIGTKLNVLIKLNRARDELFLNNQLVRHHSPSVFELSKTDARIAIGNAPDGKHGWFGGVEKFDVALVNLQKEQGETLRSYDFKSEFNYEIRDFSVSSAQLNIPKPGNFPDKCVLQFAKLEDLLSKNKTDLIVNFIGFWPIGFIVAVIVGRRFSRSRFLLPVLGAVMFGGLISLGIEVSQPMIPGRNSHFHDLLLNVLGAATGGLLFVLGAAVFALFKKTDPQPFSTG